MALCNSLDDQQQSRPTQFSASAWVRSARRRASRRARYRPHMEPDVCVVWMPGDVRTEIQLHAEDTDGAFCLVVDHPPVGWSLPAHRHHNEAETIHVVQGDFEFEVDGLRSRISAGRSIHIPRGVTHSSANIGRQTGCRVVLFSPAGMEGFFLEAGAATPDSEIDLAAVVASATRHGWEFMSGP